VMTQDDQGRDAKAPLNQRVGGSSPPRPTNKSGTSRSAEVPEVFLVLLPVLLPDRVLAFTVVPDL
jgi:hypothetical protein